MRITMTFRELLTKIFEWTIISTLWIATLVTFGYANFGCYLAAVSRLQTHNIVMLGIFLFAITTFTYAWIFNGLYHLTEEIRDYDFIDLE